MIEARTLQDESKYQETTKEVSLKVLSGAYRLLRRKQGSTVWKVYREIVRSDGAIINGLYFCTGCKRVMRSFNTSNLRTHKCHVDFLRQTLSPNAGTFSDVASSVQEVCMGTWATSSPDELNYRGTFQNASPPARRRNGNYPQPAEWSFHATELLLQFWAQNVADLRDSKKRVRVIWKITGEMKTLGFTFTEIKNKLDDIAQQYRREVHMEKTTGKPSQWEFFETIKRIIDSDIKPVENKPRGSDKPGNGTIMITISKLDGSSKDKKVENRPKRSDNSGNGSIKLNAHNKYSEYHNTSLKDKKYFMELNDEPTEPDDDYLCNDLEQSQEDVDELSELKDNIIREIEESSTVHSQENYEEELDQQNSTIKEMKRAKRKRSARMMEIQEEKLVIERKKCKLMKFFVNEMSAFRNSLYGLLNDSKEDSKS
ncbi:uncharacterized protein LOC128260179 isoform X1 [Drosophila gunungcola]|uniref:uncharacterized protein LOC128260179 isoform X1 n=1 Tax=Drosophila gunungcola TaxID=103775 RepID=UPI0022E3F97B|nr:uncharacterized protein LOC128260179 isoform X1 [Drosophila gunungcola]